MLEKWGFQALVEETITCSRETRVMSLYKFVLGIVLGLYIGFPRLNQLRFIAADPMLTGILKEPRLPPQSTLWRFLASLHLNVAAQILSIQRSIRERVWQAANIRLQTVTLDTDTTVHTLYGNQMGARKSYNPKNKGKKSYQPMLTFIAETREYLQSIEESNGVPQVWRRRSEGFWTSQLGFYVDFLGGGRFSGGDGNYPQPDFYLREARLNSVDVLHQTLLISNAPAGTLDIVLSSKGGRIEGTVVDEQSQPVAGTQTVLIADRYRDQFDGYRTAVTDSSGHFSSRGFAPGEYKIFAWEAIDEFAYFDPDFLRAFEQRGRPVSILESSRETADVRIIPAR